MKKESALIPRFVVLASLLCAPAFAAAQQAPAGPVGCPPVVVMAQAVSKDGKVELLLDVPVPVTVEERRKVLVKEGNVVKEIEVSTMVVMTKTVRRTYVVDGVKVAVMRQNLKEVAAKDLPGLVAKSTAVMMFCGKPDPYYLQVVRDDVLVVSVPEAGPMRIPAEKIPPPPAPKE